MQKLAVVQDKLAKQGRLGPVARLLPTTAATTLRKDDPPLVLDGPYAETKEQLLGFYVVDCKNLDEALDVARDLGAANPGGAYEIRPVGLSRPGVCRRDRYRLDRCRADLGTPPGGRRAAALFPQSRHRRGGVSERLPARAEELAAERPAARSRGVADHGRPQRRDRRHQAEQEAGGAARRRGDLRSRRRRGTACRAARRLALPRRHPAAAVHLLPSGPAGDAADRARAAHRLGADGQADRARLPGLGSRDGAAHHAGQGTGRRCRRAVRNAGRGGALRTPHLRRRHDLSDLQRGLFGLGRYRRDSQPPVRGGHSPGPAVAAAVPERARDHGADRAAADPACARRGAVRRRWRGDPARRSGPLASGTSRSSPRGWR